MQARVKGRNLLFEVILFDLRNIPNIIFIVSKFTEKPNKLSRKERTAFDALNQII